jgi:hypothetical protein
VTAKQIAEKGYAVKLSDDERERLNTLIRAGKHPARQLTKARILLKVDASETDGGWRVAARPSIPASTPLLGPASNPWKKASMPACPQAFAGLGQTAHL